jgi:hypothetical protein
MSKVLPREGDDGLKMGRPQLVSPEQVPLLNESVHANQGKVEEAKDLSKMITTLVKDGQQARGIQRARTIAPSNNTIKMYNYLVANQPGVTVTELGTVQTQMDHSLQRWHMSYRRHLCDWKG